MTLTASPDIDLLAQTYSAGSNALLSPASIRIALAMLARGATGETKAQLDAVSAGVNGQDARDGVLRVANSLWAAGGINSSYQNELIADFGAEANSLGDPTGAVKRINAWVSSATDEQITDLLSEGDIDSLTVLALINAITFKGTWVDAFDVERTKEAAFAAPGGSVPVMMMFRESPIRHEQGSSYQAVELPYEGDYSLHAILPTEGVDPMQALRDHQGTYGKTKVALSLPRFKMSCSSNLNEALTALGCGRMFSAKGELGGISPDPLLEVSKVVHEACIAVDEQGTTAAAATAVMVRTRSMKPRSTSMTFDRPFAFKLTRGNQVLFAGVCSEPG